MNPYVRLIRERARDRELLGESWSQLLDFSGKPYAFEKADLVRKFNSIGEFKTAEKILIDCSVPYYTDPERLRIELDDCFLPSAPRSKGCPESGCERQNADSNHTSSPNNKSGSPEHPAVSGDLAD